MTRTSRSTWALTVSHRRNYVRVTSGHHRRPGRLIWTHRAGRAMIGAMTVVKINAITVREGSGDELARRFAKRAGAVDDADGFEGFELLRPTDDRGVWLVVTRWRDDESFNAWVASPAFAHGHRGPGVRRRLAVGPAGTPTPSRPPVGAHSELSVVRHRRPPHSPVTPAG